MEYGFLIDQRKCIGCHACTVACKSENQVPVGDFRTWVKYVDKGTYPSVRRHFTVLRCNHCDAAPCVEICPVNALHKRPDKIVDLDRDLCIGCRACMQACPYDALYLNADSGTAEKCHYCAHRTEIGLEPACVIVCPEEAIVSGDVSDPSSRIAQMIAELPTQRRKVEKGTRPRVWYVDALEEALVPGSAREPKEWLWSNRRVAPCDVPGATDGLAAGNAGDVVTSYNVDHPPVWGWHIWTYLLTKNVAAGVMLFAPFAGLLGLDAGSGVFELLALVFLGITSYLLVADLGRPERFLKILFNSNPRSWLVRGTWILMGFGGLTTVALGASWWGYTGLATLVRWVNLPFAALASGYSAWLFAQCKGRDLWIESGLFAGLVLRAAFAGSALVLAFFEGRQPSGTATFVFVALALANAAQFAHEATRKMATRDAERARAVLVANGTLGGVMSLCLLAAVLAALMGSTLPAGAESVLSLFGRASLLVIVFFALFAYERLWIRSGQALPIS